ncbi:hypothetical protein AKJ09_03668 [Labilithrix luteola]|uniref:Uncharacterized protein n=1 Tax=Labilithrix luteola TaxID=1391654 RepID=A0A0K1PV43_9BACT|nr:hypothetical protein [Labilithrix luteola]AKU97004.1 hypothetical protein AKJ09_03668 [Labilithrix luteola]
MASESKKPGLALVIGVGKDKGRSKEDDDSEPDMDDEDYQASIEELADVLDISDDKREAFRDAFQAAVMSCK